MTINRVAMAHPDTKARIEAPERAVKIYEASGWEVVKDDKGESSSSTPEGANPETGEAGPKSSRKTSMTKEEGK